VTTLGGTSTGGYLKLLLLQGCLSCPGVRFYRCQVGGPERWRFQSVVLAISVGFGVPGLVLECALVEGVLGANPSSRRGRFLSQFLYLSCVYVAIQNGLPPGIAAIIAALQPLMTAALSTGRASERSGGWQWLGLLIGFVGVSIVIAGQYRGSGRSVGLVMYLLPLVSALGLTLATLYERHSVQNRDAGLVLPLFIQSC
jgi:drug/metabolite transporter (DMT)-like permease